MSRYFLMVVLILQLAGTASHAESDLDDAALQQELLSCDLLLQQGGNQAVSLNRRGFAYYRLNRIPEALAAYQQAIAADPGFALAYNNLGAAYLSIKEYPKGEAAFREALRLDPGKAKVAYNLAVALYRQNRYLDAYKAYSLAKEINATYVKQRFDKIKAREDLQRKLTDDPDNQFLLMALDKLDAE